MPKRMPRHLVMQPEEVTAPVVGENGGIVYSDKLGLGGVWIKPEGSAKKR